ncbi:MAG: molybdate ABC transporter substrate-binding protein [Candidatus Riflebacteria bacterium]|nr:molybdate ABC transporter substrate-binding protein [Candidatus Riflebacteria bacterium]
MSSNQHKCFRIFIIVFCFLVWNVASFATEQAEIIVSAAASLKNAMEAVGKIFEMKNPGGKVTFNFGGSGALLSQIIAGAPVDIFIAADIRDVQILGEKNLLATGSPKPFLRNELVFIIPGGSQLSAQSMADLKKTEWNKIAVGNPKSVPAGLYTEESLKNENLTESLQDRLVFCENVRQVLDYVIRGEVEGGFVYLTDAKTAKAGDVKQAFAVPSEKHSPIIYGLGKISTSKNPELTEKFVSFLTQPEAQEVFAAAGFILPEK